MSILQNDTVRRAWKTFVQAAIAQAIAVPDAPRQTIAVSALAAGISAVWNGIVSPYLDKLKDARAARKG